VLEITVIFILFSISTFYQMHLLEKEIDIVRKHAMESCVLLAKEIDAIKTQLTNLERINPN
jgi:uncharacterized membrane protein